MPRISIIFGYRNRDTERVKRCLDSLSDQTFSDFEVIFVDYGSTEPYKSEIQALTNLYSFVNYIYNHTVGMPWNRSHALNTGIRLVQSDYVLFGDVDLIYSSNFLENLSRFFGEKAQVFCDFFLLPENHNFNDTLLKNYPTSNAKGAIHFLPAKYLLQVGGFDEYYCFWGVEDRDLYKRLFGLELREYRISTNVTKVYHQWHPKTSNLKNSGFPDKWWEEMNIYFSLNQGKLVRNSKGWGKIYTLEDRPSLKEDFLHQSISLKPINKLYGDNSKTSTISTIVDSWCCLPPGKSLRFHFPKTGRLQDNSPYRSFFQRVVNWFAAKAGGVFLTQDNYRNLQSYVYRENNFIPEDDILYCIWSLIKMHKIRCDYCIFEKDNKVQVTLHKLATDD